MAPRCPARQPFARRRLTVAIAMVVLSAACAAPGERAPAGQRPVAPSPAVAPTTAPSPRPAAPSPRSAAPSEPSPAATAPGPWEPPAIALEPLATGLAAPVNVANDGESATLYVNEQAGRVVAIEPDGAMRSFLDLGDRVANGGERGLLGLAFHPGFADNGRLFVNYTRRGDAGEEGDTVISEFAVSEPGGGQPALVDPASERVLLVVDQPAPNHNGGQLAFGPDGHLYVALGDGGAAGDPWGNGQNREALLGKILRIDVGAGGPRSAPQPYAIPPDNPFAAGGGAPEVWLLGLRNPWRFSFDRDTGDIWIGDVGQAAREEIDRLRAGEQAGANLGWRLMEGSTCFAAPDCDPTGLVLPVAEYGHDLGASVIGGYVYRGAAQPSLVGSYFYADAYSGRIWALEAAADRPQASERLVLDGFPTSWGEDAAGELYLADAADGTLYRVVAAD